MTIRQWSRTPSIYGKCATRNGTTLDLAEELRSDFHIATKEGPGFCGSVFSGGRKKGEFFERCWFFALDIDGGVDVPELWMDALEWEFIAYSSFSDQLPGKGRRFRVIIPLAEAINAEQLRELGMWALEKWPYLDPMIKSAAMSFYTPRTPSHGIKPWFKHHHGPAMDAVAIVEERLEKKARELEERRRKAEAAMKWRRENEDFNPSPYIEAVFNTWLGKVRMAGKGERTTTLYSAARVMGGYVAGEGINPATYIMELEAAAMANGLDGNIKRHIENGIKEGESAPLMVPPPLHQNRKPAVDNPSPLSTNPSQSSLDPVSPAPEESKRLPMYQKVRESFPRAPVPHGAVIPDGYSVTRNGVFTAKQKTMPDGTFETEYKRVCPRPIFIHRRYQAIASNKDYLGFTWLDDLEGWREAKLSRSEAYSNGLVKLAEAGAPITKNSLKPMISYLEDFEHRNAGILPRVKLVDRLGWHGSEFLWGSQVITAKGIKPAERFIFDENAGDPSVLESMHKKGSFQEWVRQMNAIADYPYAWLYLAGAIAAPLLTLTDTRSFLVDLAYQTSSGKSTALFAGASAWGRPEVGHLVINWYSTNVGIEESCAMNSDLPTFVDESKLGETDPRMIRRVIYMVTGAGKKRGKAGGGLRKTKSWRTVFCTCGEQQLCAYGEDDGARARTVGAETLPFGATNDQTKVVVETLERAYLNHYGHAGPLAVQHIAQHPPSVWRESVDNYTEHFRHLSPGANSKAVRKARYFGVLRCALDILRTLGVCFDPKHLDTIWLSEAGAKDSLKSDRALEELATWVARNQDSFKGAGNRQPPKGWAGIIEEGKTVAIPKSTLKEALGDMYEATLPKIWAQTGKLPGASTKRVRVDGMRMSCYVFSWSTLFGGRDE